MSDTASSDETVQLMASSSMRTSSTTDHSNDADSASTLSSVNLDMEPGLAREDSKMLKHLERRSKNIGCFLTIFSILFLVVLTVIAFISVAILDPGNLTETFIGRW